MTMYGLLFGQNPIGHAILATLGLSPSDVGRYRDCFISEGQIAVYTRNGGGNRECFCEEDPTWGTPGCKHHIVKEEYEETGKTIIKERYFCDAPNSPECACPGCIITYRLPKHPLYICSRDDEFDRTYATIYFKFPVEFADELSKLDTGEKFEPSQRWHEAIEALTTGKTMG